MLLGESGLGKNFPVARAKLLVAKANATRTIFGRSSIQAVVKELATARTREGKTPIDESKAFVVNGELSTAIIADPDALTILTDWYDCPKEWVNLLKGDGAEKLKNVYITALFGSSPAHFYDSIPQANIEGGYIGRNLIVYEEKRSQDVDLLDTESDKQEGDKFDDYLAPKYIPHLDKIATHQGRLIPNQDAKEFFNKWRRQWRAAQKPGADRTGFLNRVPDHVLKVSMCLALSNYEFDGEITQPDIEEAINKVTNLVYSNKRTVDGRGPDPLAAPTKLVLDFLLAAEDQRLRKQQLLWKGYGNYSSFILDQVIENLLEMGWINREKVGVGANLDWLIKLAGEPLESYKKYVASKNNGR